MIIYCCQEFNTLKEAQEVAKKYENIEMIIFRKNDAGKFKLMPKQDFQDTFSGQDIRE